MDTSSEGSQSNARLRQPKPSMLSSDDNVAGERHLEPATESKAVYRSNQGFPDVGTISQTTKPTLRPWPTGHAFLCRVFEIIPRRERFIPSASQNNDPHVVVSNSIVPYCTQFCGGRWMNRVHYLRSVHRDSGNMLFLFVNGVLVSHTSPFLMSCENMRSQRRGVDGPGRRRINPGKIRGCRHVRPGIMRCPSCDQTVPRPSG